MKKIIYSFVGALFFALSVNAQEITVKLIDWRKCSRFHRDHAE